MSPKGVGFACKACQSHVPRSTLGVFRIFFQRAYSIDGIRQIKKRALAMEKVRALLAGWLNALNDLVPGFGALMLEALLPSSSDARGFEARIVRQSKWLTFENA